MKVVRNPQGNITIALVPVHLSLRGTALDSE